MQKQFSAQERKLENCKCYYRSTGGGEMNRNEIILEGEE